MTLLLQPHDTTMSVAIGAGNASTVTAAFMPYSKQICREETSERKELFEKQRTGFDDILFMISVTLEDARRARMQSPSRYSTAAYSSPSRGDAAAGRKAAPSSSSSTGLQPSPPPTKGGAPSSGNAASRGSLVVAASPNQNKPGTLTTVVDHGEVAASRSVWFPASPPRGVPAPPRPISQRIPKPLPQPLVQLLDEEAELRQWVTRLETKLRQPIERGCVDTWMVLTGPPRLEFLEYDQREELQRSEDQSWTALVAQFHREIPLSYVIEKWRGPRPSEDEEASRDPIGVEARRRLQLEREERQARKALHDWLCEMYGVRLFSTSRVEVSWRYECEEEEAEARSKLIESIVRTDYRWPLVATMALHCTKSPILGWMLSMLKRHPQTAVADKEVKQDGNQWEEL
jgi:hypothetical protein